MVSDISVIVVLVVALLNDGRLEVGTVLVPTPAHCVAGAKQLGAEMRMKFPGRVKRVGGTCNGVPLFPLEESPAPAPARPLAEEKST